MAKSGDLWIGSQRQMQTLNEGFVKQIVTPQPAEDCKAPNPRDDKMRAMSLKISTDPAPLTTDEDRVVRVGATRVRLDTVVYAFNQGASAEEILQRYPSLGLPDIYATISYYLRHRTSVEDYLKGRQQEHDRVRQLNESR